MHLDIITFTPVIITFMWSIILVSSSKSNKAKFFLGIFMFDTFLLFLSHLIYYNELKNIYIYFDLIFVFSSLSVFPMYYCYIKLLTFETHSKIKDIKYLLPAILMLIATSVTYLLMTPKLRDVYVNEYLYASGKINGAPLLIKIQLILNFTLQIIYFVQIIYSLLKIRFLIIKYNNRIANFYSNLENRTLEWPKMILYSFVLMSIGNVFTSFLGRSYFIQSTNLLLIPATGFSILIFIFGYLGNLQNNTIVISEMDNTVFQPENNDILEVVEQKYEEQNKTKDYENIHQNKLKIKLLELFEIEQVFKNKDLKISDIAIKLNTNRSYISNIINTDYNCSFSSFVNQYRVDAAKVLLLNEDCNNLCLEHISSLVGFGSLHSFIRVFKEITKTTPGRYRETNNKNVNVA